MFLQYTSRSPRTNGGLKVKHVFQIAFILLVGIWFLYQVNQPQGKDDDYDGSTKNNLRKFIGLGRKEKAGYSSGPELEGNNGKLEDVSKEEDKGRKGDELDKHSEQKAEDETETEESQPEGDGNYSGDDQMTVSDEGEILDKGIREEESAEKQEGQHEQGEREGIDTESSRTNGMDNSKVSYEVTQNDNDIADQSKMRNETQEFTDENGIPKEVTDNNVSSADNETKTIDEETISDADSGK